LFIDQVNEIPKLFHGIPAPDSSVIAAFFICDVRNILINSLRLPRLVH
jgi:hypothetical protein